MVKTSTLYLSLPMNKTKFKLYRLPTLWCPGVGEGEPQREEDGGHEHVCDSLAARVRPRHVQRLVGVLIVVL